MEGLTQATPASHSSGGILMKNHLVIYSKLDIQLTSFNLQRSLGLHFFLLSHVTYYPRSVS